MINTIFDLRIGSKLSHLCKKIIPTNIFSNTSLTTTIVNDVGIKDKFTVRKTFNIEFTIKRINNLNKQKNYTIFT